MRDWRSGLYDVPYGSARTRPPELSSLAIVCSEGRAGGARRRELGKKMDSLAGIFAGFGMMALAVVAGTPQPASAITAELAKKCRAMSIKAHPYKLPGQKGPGTAQAERAYFNECVAKGGEMPDASTTPAPPPSTPNMPSAPAK